MAAAGLTTGGSGALRHGLAARLYLLAVFLVPVQLEVAQLENLLGSRFSPADVVLAGAVVAAPHLITFDRRPVSLLPLAFAAVLAYGMLLAIVVEGAVTRHALVVKFFGGFVLVVWCVLTIAHVRAGLSLVIIRTWLTAMTFWAVVAYVDWRVADVIPYLTHDLATRFGGAQFDQNSAGVAYGVAVVFMWRYGPRVFRSQVVRTAVVVVLATALVLTLSRGAFVAVGGAIAVILVVERVGVTNWIRYVAVGCLALLVALLSGLIGAAIDEFEARPDNVASRQTLVDEALDSFVDSNGVGLGLGTQLARHGEIVHNTGIQMLVETSLVGLSFFAALVIVPMHAASRVRRFDRELGSALLGGQTVVVIASLGIDVLYQRHWWLLIGLCAVGGGVARGPTPAADRADPRAFAWTR